MLIRRDDDVQRVKTAEDQLETLKGRFWELDQMLRACEKEKQEQRLHIRLATFFLAK
jgi:hypothetical protein